MFGRKRHREIKNILLEQTNELNDLKILIESQRSEINSLRVEVEFLRKQNVELAKAYDEVKAELSEISNRIKEF